MKKPGRRMGWGRCRADLAAGFGFSAATAWRRARETIVLLAARALG